MPALSRLLDAAATLEGQMTTASRTRSGHAPWKALRNCQQLLGETVSIAEAFRQTLTDEYVAVVDQLRSEQESLDRERNRTASLEVLVAELQHQLTDARKIQEAGARRKRPSG